MNLKKEEKLLSGNWVFENGEILEDPVTKRINNLKDNYLMKIAVDESGWVNLYQDPNDKRYWELKYESSDVHGGGAPLLVNITEKDARERFNFN